LLDRAREVLSHGGRMPSLPEILVKALASPGGWGAFAMS